MIQDLSLQTTIDQERFSITYVMPATEVDLPAMQDTRWSIILRMCREAYGADVPLREVRLSHPWGACAYEHFFGCPVHYGSDPSGLTFALDTVRQPLPAVNLDLAKENDRILKELDHLLADASLASRVRREVRRALPSGTPKATAVARELAMAPRTLQRKLHEEGTTFQDVSQAVRKELAQHYLHSGEHDLDTITFLTGFANRSAFSRAYKTWTGRSPTEDRCG